MQNKQMRDERATGSINCNKVESNPGSAPFLTTVLILVPNV